ncbi:MAG: 30S ribosomal protein S16 [Deltaproteobacteria bacterium]|nr:30S ribosomal protein S16 [Deltaproteobacteria bacterium]
MSVRIRLARSGSKKKPFYRIVAADQRMKRDGRYIEKLGTYNSMSKELSLDREGVEKWLSVGASPSDTVNRLLIKEGFELKPAHNLKREKKPKEGDEKPAIEVAETVKAEDKPAAEESKPEAVKAEEKPEA